MHKLLRSNVNFFWAGVLVETLKQRGLKRAIISPGSRSAPLTAAFALTDGIESTPVLDERSAGFYALGLAKASGRPVALVCTSGTAAANYLPAVVEAKQAGVPLIVLTADRPPELRDCASGQAIDQQKLFGDYVTWFHDLALPEAKLLPYMRNMVRQAWRSSWHGQGPTHINVPFREPLAPVSDGETWKVPAHFWDKPEPLPRPLTEHEGILKALQDAGDGIIIAGPHDSPDPEAYARGVEELARCLGWPILADALSPLRHHASSGIHLVAHYDAILRDPAQAAKLAPQAVLQLGPLPTSKVLRAWLGQFDVPTWIAATQPNNYDPLHRATAHWITRFEQLLRLGALADEPSELTIAWAQAEQIASRRLEDALEDCDHLFEGRLPWLLSEHLPEGTPVFVASSMPVRDVEFFWPVNDKGFRVASNRGANGIDGTISSALGYTEMVGKPGILVTGDLAFLHDSNGLLLTKDFTGSLTVIVVNNGGGGIFEKLAIAEFDPPFERFFATPQEVDFVKLAEAYGIPHVVPESWDELEVLLLELPTRGLQIIELKTDRKADMALRGKILASK